MDDAEVVAGLQTLHSQLEGVAMTVSNVLNGLFKSHQRVNTPYVLAEFGGHLNLIAAAWPFFDEAMTERIWLLFMALHKKLVCKLSELEASKELAEHVKEWKPKIPGEKWPCIENAKGYKDLFKTAAPALDEKIAKEKARDAAVKAAKEAKA